MNALLEASRISKSYRQLGDDITIIENVDLSVQIGETIVIWGASGSGKTTLLQILGGVMKPDSGKVLFKGKLIENLNAQKKKMSSIGWIFQVPLVLETWTVKENLSILAAMNGLDTEELDEKVIELSTSFGIDELLENYGSELSEGEKRRVTIARALLFEPELLIMDEPTAGLDDSTKEAVTLQIFESTRFRAVPKIIATHDIRYRELEARHLVIQNGTLVPTDF